MRAVARLLRIILLRSVQEERRSMPRVLVTVTINGIPDLISWGEYGEVPFDG